MHILRCRLDFSQCKKPAAPNGKRYMHCLHAFPLSSSSHSLTLSLSLLLYSTKERRKRAEQAGRQTCVFSFIFLCVALLLINKHALWQGLLNQAPIPCPTSHFTHHLSVHPKRDSRGEAQPRGGSATKRIHTRACLHTKQYKSNDNAYTRTHTHVGQSKLSWYAHAALKLKLRANVGVRVCVCVCVAVI